MLCGYHCYVARNLFCDHQLVRTCIMIRHYHLRHYRWKFIKSVMASLEVQPTRRCKDLSYVILSWLLNSVFPPSSEYGTLTIWQNVKLEIFLSNMHHLCWCATLWFVNTLIWSNLLFRFKCLETCICVPCILYIHRCMLHIYMYVSICT